MFTSFFLTYYCLAYLRLIKIRLKEDKEQKNIKEKDDFPGTYMVGNELFYKIRQKQYSCLYLANILFSFLEFIFDILLKIKYNNNEISLNYIDFFSFFTLFIHNSTNFMSFFWIIRKQYSFKIPEKISIQYSDIFRNRDTCNIGIIKSIRTNFCNTVGQSY